MAQFDIEYEYGEPAAIQTAMASYCRFIGIGDRDCRLSSLLQRIRDCVVEGQNLPPNYRSRIPHFLDTLVEWLIYGDGVDVCKTFETYLMAVISLMASWQRRFSDDDLVDGRFIRLLVRQFEKLDDTRTYRQPDPMYWWSNNAPTVQISEELRLTGFGGPTWDHPALSRATWELAVTAVARGPWVVSTVE